MNDLSNVTYNVDTGRYSDGFRTTFWQDFSFADLITDTLLKRWKL
jgi:hypothetical protein